MEDIITLNGVEYVKKETIKEMEAELKNLKAILIDVHRLTGNISNDVAATKSSRAKINVNDEDIFKIPPTAQTTYEIKFMSDNGEFFTKNNRKLKEITIKEVFIAQKEISRGTTVKEARELRKKLGINNYTFNRLVYNVQQGTFTEFIRQWNKKTQPIVGKKQVPFENNVEKRKEKGYV